MSTICKLAHNVTKLFTTEGDINKLRNEASNNNFLNIWDIDILRTINFDKITHIHFGASMCDIEILKCFKNLNSISFCDYDNYLEAFPNLPHPELIEEIVIGGGQQLIDKLSKSEITINQFTGLKKLHLGNCKVRRNIFKTVKPSLEYLYCCDVHKDGNLNADFFEEISTLEIKSLEIGCLDLKPGNLSRMKSLEKFSICASDIQDESFKDTHIKELEIYAMNITENTLKHLEHLEKLVIIRVKGFDINMLNELPNLHELKIILCDINVEELMRKQNNNLHIEVSDQEEC